MSLPAGSVRHADGKRLQASTEELVRDLIGRVSEEPWEKSQMLARLMGVLSAEIETRPTLANRFSADKSMMPIANLAGHPDVDRNTLAQLRDTVCLDFGCGGLNPLGGSFALLLAGARRGIAVDLDDIRSTSCATRALYTVLCAALTGTTEPPIPGSADQILERIASFDIKLLARGNPQGIDGQRLEYVQKPLHEVGLDDGSIDVCFSNSVFEHIGDPDEVLAELARVTRPGGIASHAIDGYDHRYYADANLHPLEFLTDASTDALLYGCNRIRPLAFAEVFERHGFEVRGTLESPPIELPDELLERLAPAYRDLPRKHLETGRVRYYLRRR